MAEQSRRFLAGTLIWVHSVQKLQPEGSVGFDTLAEAEAYAQPRRLAVYDTQGKPRPSFITQPWEMPCVWQASTDFLGSVCLRCGAEERYQDGRSVYVYPVVP